MSQERGRGPGAGSYIEYIFQNKFSFFSSKTFVLGTQKNRLSETVL